MADFDSNSARRSYRTPVPSIKRRDSANNARDASNSRPSTSRTAAKTQISFLDGRSGNPIDLDDTTDNSSDDSDSDLPPRKRTRSEKPQSFEDIVWDQAPPFSIMARTFLSNAKKEDNFHSHGKYWKVGEYDAKIFQMPAEAKLRQQCQRDFRRWRAVKWSATARYNKTKEDWIVTTFSHTGEFNINGQWREFEENIKQMIKSGKKNISASLSLEYEIFETEEFRALVAKVMEEDAANRPSKPGPVDKADKLVCFLFFFTNSRQRRLRLKRTHWRSGKREPKS